MRYFIIRFCFYRTCSYLICEPSHNSINATYLIRFTSFTCHCLWKYLFQRMLFDPFKVLFLTLWDEFWGSLFSPFSKYSGISKVVHFESDYSGNSTCREKQWKLGFERVGIESEQFRGVKPGVRGWNFRYRLISRVKKTIAKFKWHVIRVAIITTW